jgi:3-oxoacyl-(acyl-carrier-protein) synthase
MKPNSRQQRRVVVTGMGTVNPIGKNVREFWPRCVQGVSGVRRITAFDVPDGISGMAGIVDDFVPGVAAADAAVLDRSTLLALVAAREAWAMARFDGNLDRARVGVYVSTAIAQIAGMEESFLRQSDRGRRHLRLDPAREQPPGMWELFQFNTTAHALAQHLETLGGYATVTTGCTGGLDAIGYAIDAVRAGDVDVAVTGATEAPITPLVVAAFAKVGATSLRNSQPQQASRPFDVDRDGFVLAEGSGMLVIEELEHARSRGAEILAELRGYGTINNYYHMTDIPEDGLRIAKSAELAMLDAGISPDAVDAINAHGSSTRQNDVAESNAYWHLFGSRAAEIPVTSLKSQIGHPLSASNSVEVVASILSLRTGIIPPTINLQHQDPRCRLDVVGNVARKADVHCLLKTSSGFSGIHSSLVISRTDAS